MANTSHSMSSSLEYTTQPAQLSCQFPMEQWFEGGTSDVDPGDLYLSLHDSIFYNDAHYTQDFSFPQSRGLEMHDYTMALDPSATLQHYATSPPVEYLQPGGLSCGNGVLDFCSMPLEAMSTVYPFSGYPEPSLFSDFGDSSENNSTPISTTNEEDEADKPYAKLIYEALMQTPGHRMTLREIYEWFVENTSKPQDSGSNGWQNSIRHNLSMNQAFENDKSEPSTRGHPRKANSVWVLTDNAIRNGVQSTTRYRKTGTGKRVAHRMPAPQRQRSGARGGRAARRSAARSRKEDEDRYKAAQQVSPPLDITPLHSPPVTCCDRSPEGCSKRYNQPLAHADEDRLMLFYDRPPVSYTVQQSPIPVKVEHDDPFGGGLRTNDPLYFPDAEHGLDELCKWESD